MKILIFFLVIFTSISSYSKQFIVNFRYVYDGDTIAIILPQMPPPLDKAYIRLLGIDTPELKGKCLEEKQKAIEAKNKLIELIGNSKTIILTDYKYDKFGGRIDANVIINISQELIKAGLARPYYGDLKQSWCVR